MQIYRKAVMLKTYCLRSKSVGLNTVEEGRRQTALSRMLTDYRRNGVGHLRMGGELYFTKHKFYWLILTTGHQP